MQSNDHGTRDTAVRIIFPKIKREDRVKVVSSCAVKYNTSADTRPRAP